MEKKIKFQESPAASKIVYAIVVAILAVSAIVVGIISAASTKETPEPNDSIVNPDTENGGSEENKNTAPTFTSPVEGEIISHHSATVPVYSDTLGEWRIHTGIDICTNEGASVFAAADGEVSRIFSDEMLGLTVEITHSGNIKTLYSNLADDGSISVSVGDKVKSGDSIGVVGDTSISELAEEAHLHFEMLVGEVSVNPLDYFANSESDKNLTA